MKNLKKVCYRRSLRESEDTFTEKFYEDKDIKITAQPIPLYNSGWSEDADEDTSDTQDVIIAVKTEIKNPQGPLSSLGNGIYYLAVQFLQDYEYVETRHWEATWWEPGESEGFYEPVGETYVSDEVCEFFTTKEDAEAFLEKQDWSRAVTINNDSYIWDHIDINDTMIWAWMDEPLTIDPEGVSDSYYSKFDDYDD